jgi:putative methionine-R-sulfoxide reductase with GAF domain
MPGKLTLYPPQRAARFLIVRDGEELEIGRDPRCGLVLEDARVSKRHARLRWTGRGWAIDDLGSKNGTTVNGERPHGGELGDGAWISLGGLMGCFERLTPAQAANLDSERLARIQTSADLQRRLGAHLEPVDLVLCFLELAREVTRTERGFLLVTGPDGSLRVEVAAGFKAEDVRDERFRGSAGAVKEALETGAAVVIADVPADPRLGKRPSVVSQGIGSLACVPLRHEGKVLGVIYVDSRKLVRPFTTMDIDILESLADHTARVLADCLPDRKIRHVLLPQEGELIVQLQQRLEELLPAV